MNIRKNLILNGACLAVAFLSLASGARAQEENGWCIHKQMYVVPAPKDKKVVIDGKLDEWDLSAAIESYVMPETRENQNARFALMYDDEALYIGAIVRDPTPLRNQRDPATEGNMGWDGDAVQFRICVDSAQGHPVNDATWYKEHINSLVHMTLWNYSDKQQPVLVVQTGMDYQPVPGAGKFSVIQNEKYQAKYQMAEDGRGYSFEYRIPWSTLTAKQPLKAGDIVAATVQILWGKNGNEHIGVNGVTYDLQMPGGFAYQNAGVWGKVIFSKEGNLSKDMVSQGARPEKPVPLTFDYDLPESGEVTLQLFNDRNEVVRVLAGEAPRSAGKNTERWDGLDALGRPLPAGKYTWKGLVHQPITTQHIMSVENSGTPPWKNDDNTGGWGGDHAPPSSVCAAGDDMILGWISAEAGYGLIRVNPDGRKQWGALRSGINHLVSDGERVYLSSGFSEEEVHPTLRDCHGIEMLAVKDFRPMLYGNGSKVIPIPSDTPKEENVVSGLALSKGTLFAAYKQRNLIISYDAIQGDKKETWTVPSPGNLAARPDGSLVLLSENKLSTFKEGKISVLATDHLDEPKGVALDSSGNIYVSNYGKLQNVSVFSPEGKYLRSIGREGGRPMVGTYDAKGMLFPRDIALDTKGRLWVAESIEAPKRVSVWNAETGALDREFFGCAHYSADIWMDPEHPDEVYCDNVLWKVDLDKKTWSPKSTVWRPKGPNSPGYFGTHGSDFQIFTAKNGRQYACGVDDHLGMVMSVREGDILKPFMMFFWTAQAVKRAGFPLTADPKKYPDFATHIWVDQNDDQILQESEITTAANFSPEAAKLYFRGFSTIDKDLNLWHARGAINRPVRILPDGRPEYDFAKPEPIPVKETAYVDAAGDAYTLTEDDNHPEKVGFGKWSPDGKLLWGMNGFANWPKAISYPVQKPGKLWGSSAVLGTAGDFTGFNTYFGVPHIYTSDGLFVSRIMRDVRAVSENLGADIISSENYNGCLVKPKGTNRYFFLGGDQDGRVTEVLGLDTIKRLKGGEFVLTEADVKKSADAFAAYHTQLAEAQRLLLTKGKGSLGSGGPVGKILDTKRNFEVKTAYDDKNLYVEYKVMSPVKLANGITEPSLIFKGGNLLDIQIAADPNADPKRKKPVVGDTRILISRQNDKPVAVIYRPKVTGFQGEPTVLTSPVGKEPFDQIEVSDKITVDYKDNPNLQSFTAVVTIPLDLIGLKPESGKNVKMDFGYIFGNDGGTKAMARSYWKNNGFNANVLNDVPSESRLDPAEWGIAEVQ